MTADTLAPCASRSSAVTVLTMYDKRVIVYREEGFQRPVRSLTLSRDSKLLTFLMGPWDPWTMIIMGHRALGMGSIFDIFIHWKI